MSNIQFGMAVVEEYMRRVMGGRIPEDVEGVVFGFATNGYYAVNVGNSADVQDLPAKKYEGDAIESVEALLQDKRLVGIAVLDGSIAQHLKQTGELEVDGNEKPFKYHRDGKTLHVF